MVKHPFDSNSNKVETSDVVKPNIVINFVDVKPNIVESYVDVKPNDIKVFVDLNQMLILNTFFKPSVSKFADNEANAAGFFFYKCEI